MNQTSPETTPLERVKAWIQANPLAVGGVAVVGVLATLSLSAALALGGDPDPDSDPTVAAPTETTGSTTTSVASGPTTSDIDETVPGTTRPVGQADGLIAVKIDNAPEARPQIGLDSAQWIFETPVEGGLTRFLAFFPAGDRLVGPVRSVRPVDVDLVGLFSDTLLSTGGQPFVLGPLEGNGVNLIGPDDEASPFQTLERPAPHNRFAFLGELGAVSLGDGFEEGELPDGEATETIDLTPFPIMWTFQDDAYLRSEDGQAFSILPEFDAEPQQLSVDTVVVLDVNQRSAGYQDVEGSEVPTFDVIGAGAVRVYHQGSVVEGTWTRASLNDNYHLMDQNGGAFGLPSGRTFIHLLPSVELAN